MKETKKETKQIRRLGIRADCPPDCTSDEQLKMYQRANFNILTMTEDFVRARSKAYLDCLRNCEKLGLDVYLRGYGQYFGEYFEKFFTGVDFNDYPAVKGFFFLDEPAGCDIPRIANAAVDWFNDTYAETGMDFYLNSYCGEVPWHLCMPSEDFHEYLMTEIYDKLNTENKILTIDEYPLRRGIDGKKYLDEREWIPYTAQVARICRDHGVKFGGYLQTFGGDYVDARIPDTIEEIRFMAYVYLAFGAQHIGYFVYLGNRDIGFMGLVNDAGRPSKLYYHARALNEELLSFDIEYLSYDWKGTLVIDGESNETPNEAFAKTREFLPYADKELTAVTAENNLIVGCFEKGKNEHAYIVVSYGEPTVQQDNKMTFTLKTAKKLEILRNGRKVTTETKMEKVNGLKPREIVEVKDGKVEIELKYGEALFIKTIS